MASKKQTQSKGSVKIFELAHKDTGFSDRATGVKVVRNGTVEIDMSKKVGKLTLDAIRAGRLIEVSAPAAAPEEKTE